jgi:non-lysosomal glucosylceramidase
MRGFRLILVVVLCGVLISTLVYAGSQFPGQDAGQAAAIAATLADTGPRSFTGDKLAKLNYPLAGLGTGIIYFNGGAKPARWDIGSLGNASLMADNSLFAISVNNGGNRITKKLLAAASANAFDTQPTASTRSAFNKQGTYFIGTCEVPPGYTTWDDTMTGMLDSNSFVMPSTCTKITVLVGGGNDINNEYLALVDAGNGAVLSSLTGDNAEGMTAKTMNIGTAYSGRNVFFRIVDNATGGWGHINLDNIQLKNASDQVVSSTFQNGDFETGNLTGWTKKTIGAAGGYGSTVVTIEYPVAKYAFTDPTMVVDAELEMFNPMVPLSERDSIIPTGVFNIKLTNKASNSVTVSVLSSLANGLAGTSRTNTASNDSYGTYVTMTSAGFTDGTMQEGSLCLWTGTTGATYCGGTATADDLVTQINTNGSLNGTGSGNATTPVAGVCAPITLAVGETKTVSFTWSWYFPHMLGSNIWGSDNSDVSRRYVNYYNNVTGVMQDVKTRWSAIVDKTKLYHDTIYDSNLPYYFIDAVTANSDIMRSPTMFVTKVGDVYAWEGSDGSGGGGCCNGNCMHVWNYAEALANLYPDLARRWKTIDFTRQQTANGLLNNRIGSVPAPSSPSGEGVAIDGTLGTIAAAYREHINSPDNSFLTSLWTRIKNAMDGAIAAWDPNHDGVNENAANTTFDGAVYGENSFVAAQYLAALRASEEMAKVMGDNTSATTYHNLFVSGSNKLNIDTYNGEYYYQVGAGEYGPGMMADHLLGQSHAFQYGLGYLLPQDRVYSSMDSVFKYNFFSPVGTHYQAQWGDPNRVMAKPDDDALLICTFPNGGSGTALYLTEDWPGFDYEVAADLLYLGNADKALTIVHAVRTRQDGKDFDVLNERECGGYYARSLSSYGIMVAATGIEKNGPQKMLGFKPNLTPQNIKAFFTDVTGWGTFEQTRNVAGNVTTQDDKVTVKYGTLNLRTLQFYYPEPLLQRATTVQATVKIDGATIATTTTVTNNQVKLTFGSDNQVNAGSVVDAIITVTDNGPLATATPSPTPTPTPTAAPRNIPLSGLQIWLKFDESSGTTAADSSGNSRTGTLTGGPVWSTDGKYSGSVSLDGFDDWVNIPDLSYSGDFTVGAWVKLSGTIDNMDAIVGQEGLGQDINFYALKCRLYGPNDMVVATSNIAADTWTHYTISRTGSNLKLYINGTQNATGTWTGAFTPKAIGRGNAGFTLGKIDDFVIYNRALSDTEVLQLVNNSAATPTPGATATPTPTPTPTPLSTATPTPTPAGTATPTPVGFSTNLTGWSVVNGTWTDVTGGKQGSLTTDNAFILAAESGTDFTYEGDLKISSGNAAALVFRSAATPLTGSYCVNIDSVEGGGRVKLFKFPYVMISYYTTTITVGTTYHLKVVAAGSNFKVYFNNGTTPVIDANDTSFTSGRFGLNVFMSTSLFQNVYKN